jgi:DNA polymerase III epsilon subunit-like protein
MQLTQRPLPKYGFGIDWETSGSAWGEDSTIDFQGVSFGAVVFDLATFEPVETIYREIKFDATRYKWSEGAQRVHGLSREHLEANGVTQEEASVALMEMYIKYFAPDERVFIIGHHTDFDIKFTQQLLEQFGIMFQVGATIMDTAGTGLINFGIHKSEDLFQFLGLPARTTHNALEDILLTLKAAQTMRAIFNAALNG